MYPREGPEDPDPLLMKITNILLCGVGGQGILRAAKIMAETAGLAGHDVRTNEIHGMAQRGGSVVAHLRYGEKLYSPLILEGTADSIFAMEPAEALRWAHFLRPGGFAAISTHRVTPVTVSCGQEAYPADIEERLERVFPDRVTADCTRLAAVLGNARLANTILTGALSRVLEFSPELWREAIARSVPESFFELNWKAFEAGRNL